MSPAMSLIKTVLRKNENLGHAQVKHLHIIDYSGSGKVDLGFPFSSLNTIQSRCVSVAWMKSMRNVPRVKPDPDRVEASRKEYCHHESAAHRHVAPDKLVRRVLELPFAAQSHDSYQYDGDFPYNNTFPKRGRIMWSLPRESAGT